MNEGFQEAKQQRNWLERLGEKIPGFRGYRDRELRRDVDRMQREYLAGRLGELKNSIRGLARDYTDAGQIGTLHLFERMDRNLDGLSQGIRFADYGVSGLFDAIKVGVDELDRLYEFDLSLLADLDQLAVATAAIPGPGDGGPEEAIGAVLDQVAALRAKWSDRKNVIASVVKTSP